MKRQCEGYCGGMVKLENVVQIGREGERMCGECAAKRLDEMVEQYNQQ